MDEKVREIMSVILEIDAGEINNQTSTETIDSWDSMNQMNLITALEDEFNIHFGDDEISELISYKLIIEALKSHQNDETGQ
jgi:acyl carrier protein